MATSTKQAASANEAATTQRTHQQGGQSKKAAKKKVTKAQPQEASVSTKAQSPEFVKDEPPSGGGGTSQWDEVIDRLLYNDDTERGTWYRLWTISPDEVDDPAKDARRRANGIRGRSRKRNDTSGIEVAVRPTGDGRHGVWARVAKQADTSGS